MLDNLAKLSDAVLKSISPENITGKKGMGGATPLEEGTAKLAARDLDTGWKVNPYFRVDPGQTFTLADVEDQDEITQIWLTPTGNWRGQILRIFWDGETVPARRVD